MATLRSLAQAISYTGRWVTSPARLRGEPALPTLLNLPITDNCNSRCVMCDVWKERSTGEMTAASLGRVLGDRLFADVRHAGISGGEPSLRRDLADVVQALVDTLPRLGTVSITTHGFLPRMWEQLLPRIVDHCRRRGVRLTLNMSVDGVGEMHDRVRGIPHGFGRVLRSLDQARRAGAAVQLQATISAPNVYHTGRLLQFARTHGYSIVFRRAVTIPRLDNEVSMSRVELHAGERSFLADFLTSPALLRSTRNVARRLYYREQARRLSGGGSRQAPCYFQSEGVLLDPHGFLFHCSISTAPLGNALEHSAFDLYFSPAAAAIRRDLLARTCPSCAHDQSGAWSPRALAGEMVALSSSGRVVSRVAEVGSMGLQFASLEVRRAFATVGRLPNPAAASVKAAPTALLIGAYGGEHVGDAAILGGVVLRLQKRYGILRGIVASTRADRTARWLTSLSLPIPLEVISANDTSLTERLQPGDLLVHAGGPLMDLPRSLIRHLRLAVSARRRGSRVLLEGIGVGPFRRRTSRMLAKRLCGLADEIRVRSRRSQADPIVPRGVALLDRDPAFDYIESRGRSSALDRLPDSERSAVDEAVGHDVGLTIGINLRPLWYKYVKGRRADLHALTTAFQAELLIGMERFATGRRVRWVFFPMNADQYGFSDLDAGWELADLARGRADVHVIEHELGVDAVLYLLDQLDATIAMRFHANVFAMARGVRSLGIDYSIGTAGKVTDLYRDSGLDDRVRALEAFTGVWMAGALESLLGETRSPDQLVSSS